VTVKDGARPRADHDGVVVWLEGGEAGGQPIAGGERGTFSMRSEDKAFTPRVLAVPVGAVVDFPNSDPIFHNVFSVSKTRRFDLGLYKLGASKSVTFDRPGLVRVYCNIHPQMVGFIHVFAIAHFAVTDADGQFTLAAVTPGRYALKAWDERGGVVSQALVVGDGPTSVSIEIDAHKHRQEPHLNKYGKPYERGASGERY